MKADNKRILINTIVLYCRMMLVMFVSFFTTRIVLKVLGVEDYGLVNVIGGVVGMFGFISIALSTACSRYFSYELGCGDDMRLNQMFSMMLLLYGLTAIIILVLFESAGLWYVRNKLVCSVSRLNAANLFFQITVVTVMVNWFTVPYSALIIAHEEFSLYAFLSMVDVGLKLVSALGVLFVHSYDHLVTYGLFVLGAALVHATLYVSISYNKYPQSHFRYYFDKKRFGEICRFNGWRMFGVLSWTTSDTLVNLLLNSFFGPVVNAARAIAVQLNGCVRMFTSNFLTATNPQLIKIWASGNKQEFYSLLARVSKLAYFLVFFFALPLYVELPIVLEWWLGGIPEYVIPFTRLVLISALPNIFVLPLETAAQAVGKIGLTEGLGNGTLLLMWPLSWVALAAGCSPEKVFVIAIIIAVLRTFIYFMVVLKLVGYSRRIFLREVFLRLAVASVLSFTVVRAVSMCFDSGVMRFLVVGTTSVAVTIICFMFAALNKQERLLIVRSIKDFVNKKIK